MRIWIVIIMICLIILVIIPIFKYQSKTREGMSINHPRWKTFYGRPGIPSISMDIPIPENPESLGQTYVDYHNSKWNKLCPSPVGTHCRNYLDCGPAELCVDQAGYIVKEEAPIQPESAVCVCSIQNPCALAGNIC